MLRRQLLKSLPVAAAPIVAGALPTRGAAGTNDKVTVMNPAVTEKLAARVPLAPRLDTLDGKTIYIVDTNYEGMGPTPVMRDMKDWFAAHLPKVNAVYKLKGGNYAEDDPALWKEIAAAKGDGVIIGVAG